MKVSARKIVVLVALSLLAAPIVWAASGEDDITIFVKQPPARGKVLAVRHTKPGPVMPPITKEPEKQPGMMGAPSQDEGSALRSGSLGGIQFGGSFGATSSRDAAVRRLQKTIRDLG